MEDQDKTKEQPINELIEMRQRIVELEAAEAEVRQTDQALLDSERRFRSIVQTASDAIIICDSHENVISWNDAARNIFGYEAYETTGDLFGAIMTERFHQIYRAEMQQVISTGTSLPELWQRPYLTDATPPASLDPQAEQLRLNETVAQVLRVPTSTSER